MTAFRSAAFAALFWTGITTPALACTLKQGTVLPTNYELVQQADAIVVARVVSGYQANRRETPYDKSVHLRIERKLKGETPAEMDLTGFFIGSPPPSDPNELNRANPEAYYGACSRHSLSLNKSYVLFLRNDGSEWRILPYAFSRTSEDYFGEDSLWVRTIETYADVQARLAPDAQIDEIERMWTAKRAMPPSKYRDVEAEDMLAYLQRVDRVR